MLKNAFLLTHAKTRLVPGRPRRVKSRRDFSASDQVSSRVMRKRAGSDRSRVNPNRS
jgi:hypothetical protein